MEAPLLTELEELSSGGGMVYTPRLERGAINGLGVRISPGVPKLKYYARVGQLEESRDFLDYLENLG